MEHLPEVQDQAYPTPQIPYLGDLIQYDQAGFNDFPARHGWTFPNRKSGDDLISQPQPYNVDPNLSTPKYVAAVIQAWLFYGVLDEVFNRVLGVDLHLEDFVRRNEDDEQVITTKDLPRYLDKWAIWEEDIEHDHYSGTNLRPDDYYQQKHAEIREVLISVHLFFHKQLDFRQPSWSSSFDTDMQVSILILAETIRNAAIYIWREWQPLPSAQVVMIHGTDRVAVPFNQQRNVKRNTKQLPLETLSFSRPRNLLEDRMEDLGWCPLERRMVFDMVSRNNTGLYLASQTRRAFSDKHLSHADCSNEMCTASQIKTGAYSTRHLQACNPGDCEMVAINVDIVSDKIKRGTVPLISLPWDSRSANRVVLRPTIVESVPYVTISHVWAHGLGNENDNSLPLCRLKQLRDIVHYFAVAETMPAEPAIWLDTLCIPVQPHLKQIRKKAISQISDVFAKSEATLVLDADLMQVSKYCSRAELATRILTSGWMRRLWTLNEAVITGDSPNCLKLHIIFKDGQRPFNNLFQKDILTLYHSEAAFRALTQRMPQVISASDSFHHLMKALEYRSTSRREDEALCLASILNFHVPKIFEHNSAEARMRAFYSMLDEVPTSIFFHHEPRLPSEGYRWAPQSLMINGRAIGSLIRTDATAKVTAEGLLLSLPDAFIVTHLLPVRHGKSSPRGQYLFLSPDGDRTVWHVTPKLSFDGDFRGTFCTPGGGFETILAEQRAFEQAFTSCKKPVLLQNPSTYTDVIIADVYRQGGSVYFCSYQTRAQLFRWKAGVSFEPLERYTGMMEADNAYEKIAVERLPSDAMICVG